MLDCYDLFNHHVPFLFFLLDSCAPLGGHLLSVSAAKLVADLFLKSFYLRVAKGSGDQAASYVQRTFRL